MCSNISRSGESLHPPNCLAIPTKLLPLSLQTCTSTLRLLIKFRVQTIKLSVDISVTSSRTTGGEARKQSDPTFLLSVTNGNIHRTKNVHSGIRKETNMHSPYQLAKFLFVVGTVWLVLYLIFI